MLRKGVSRKAKPSTEAPVNGGRKAVAALERQRFRTNSAICWETRSVSGATRKSDNASSAGNQQERPEVMYVKQHFADRRVSGKTGER